MSLKQSIFNNKFAQFRINMSKNNKSLYAIQHKLTK